MKQVIDVMKDFMNKLSNGGNEISEENKQTGKKKSYVCYVYGQIFKAYLVGEKNQYTLVENTMVQTWRSILGWMKKEGYIEDYQLGDTPETAGKVVIKGFNENDMIYKSYCKAILEKYEEEKENVCA